MSRRQAVGVIGIGLAALLVGYGVTQSLASPDADPVPPIELDAPSPDPPSTSAPPVAPVVPPPTLAPSPPPVPPPAPRPAPPPPSDDDDADDDVDDDADDDVGDDD